MRQVIFRLCLLILIICAALSTAFAADAKRSYVSGNFFMELDGVKCGFIRSIAGGGVSAEVINELGGPNYFIKKHVGQPIYLPFTMDVGFSMTKGVYEWIRQMWSMNLQRRNCAITSLDYNLTPKVTMQYSNCLLTEVTIPACDGASKEPAYMSFTIAPELARQVTPAQTNSKAYGEYGKNEQKMWLPSNFVLQIDGLDCTKVNKIDSFTVKWGAITDDIGAARDYLKTPGKLDFPNLKISLADITADTWRKWFDEFVVKGNNGETNEKNGTLLLLPPNGDRTKPLCTIILHNLGIYKLEREKAQVGADQIKRVTAELYCERMEFLYGPNTIADSGDESKEPAVAMRPADR